MTRSEQPSAELSGFGDGRFDNRASRDIEGHGRVLLDASFVLTPGIAGVEKRCAIAVVPPVNGAPFVAVQPVSVGRERYKQPDRPFRHFDEFTRIAA